MFYPSFHIFILVLIGGGGKCGLGNRSAISHFLFNPTSQHSCLCLKNNKNLFFGFLLQKPNLS